MRNPEIKKANPLSVRKVSLKLIGGAVEICGPTVRAFRRLLESVDQDAVIVYLAELTPEVRDSLKRSDTIIGVIGGVAAADDAVLLFGPEVTSAIQNNFEDKQ